MKKKKNNTHHATVYWHGGSVPTAYGIPRRLRYILSSILPRSRSNRVDSAGVFRTLQLGTAPRHVGVLAQSVLHQHHHIDLPLRKLIRTGWMAYPLRYVVYYQMAQLLNTTTPLLFYCDMHVTIGPQALGSPIDSLLKKCTPL